MMITLECYYTEPAHEHEFSDDWEFGGPDELDPRADPRWKPTTYTYYDADVTELHVTQTPLCDDQALDEFTLVASWYNGKARPTWLSAKRPDGTVDMLPWTYDVDTDMLEPS